MFSDITFDDLKSCKAYQNYGQDLELIEKSDQIQRWVDVIPENAYINYKTIPRRDSLCIYQGNGLVKHLITEEISSLAHWFMKVHLARLNNNSSPICNVLMYDMHTREILFVPLKLFNYIPLERKIEFNGLQWYFDQIPLNLFEVSNECKILIPVNTPLTRKEKEDEEDEIIMPKTKHQKLNLSENEVLNIPVAYIQNEKDHNPKKKLTDSARRTVWEVCYGKSPIATCMMCGVAELDFSRKSETQFCHINPRSLMGRNDKIYNFIFACGTCNNGASRTCNIFDQLIHNGHMDNIKRVCEAALRLYCKSEAYLNYSFAGRKDFVEKVYGLTDDEVPSGIQEVDVLRYLDELDKISPLAPALLNPILRSINDIR